MYYPLLCERDDFDSFFPKKETSFLFAEKYTNKIASYCVNFINFPLDGSLLQFLKDRAKFG